MIKRYYKVEKRHNQAWMLIRWLETDDDNIKQPTLVDEVAYTTRAAAVAVGRSWAEWVRSDNVGLRAEIDLMIPKQCPCDDQCIDVINDSADLRELVRSLKSALEECGKWLMPDVLLPGRINQVARDHYIAKAKAALKEKP